MISALANQSALDCALQDAVNLLPTRRQALTSTRGCATAARRGSRPDRGWPIIATLAIWSKRG